MSALKWAKRRQEQSSASEKLGKLPESSTGHGAAVPFPYRDRETYKSGTSNKEINSKIRSAPVQKVPLKGLHAIQHSVKADRVEQYIRDPALSQHGDKHSRAGTPIDYPVVMQKDGVRYIHDGHHRLTAKELAGKGYARVRLVQL